MPNPTIHTTFAFDAGEEAIRRNDHFPVGYVRGNWQGLKGPRG
jgi:hypothetical protein